MPGNRNKQSGADNKQKNIKMKNLRIGKENKKISSLFYGGRSGQALIEAIASIGIVVVGVLGTLAFLSTSIGLNRVVTGEYAGTYLGAAFVEKYKNCLDTEGFDKKDFCLDDSLSEIGDEVVLNGTTFHLFYNDSSCESDVFSKEDRVNVCITVKWSEKGSDFLVNVEDHFYNWR